MILKPGNLWSHIWVNKITDYGLCEYKYLAKSFRVFSVSLAAGLQPAAQCRRLANPVGAMLGTYGQLLITLFIYPYYIVNTTKFIIIKPQIEQNINVIH